MILFNIIEKEERFNVVATITAVTSLHSFNLFVCVCLANAAIFIYTDYQNCLNIESRKECRVCLLYCLLYEWIVVFMPRRLFILLLLSLPFAVTNTLFLAGLDFFSCVMWCAPTAFC